MLVNGAVVFRNGQKVGEEGRDSSVACSWDDLGRGRCCDYQESRGAQ